MEWDFIPTPHLFMISVSCCEASRTCLRRLSTNTERGVRDSPQPMAGGAGIWEPAPWPAGVAGTGEGRWEMWLVPPRPPAPSGRRRAHPASGAACEHSSPGNPGAARTQHKQPLLNHLEATEKQTQPSNPSSPPPLSCRDHPSAPGRPWCPRWMSR